MDYKACRQVEQDGRVWWRQPVPDPVSPEQARFEAMAVLVLARELCDRQLGSLFGLKGIDLLQARPVCLLHPAMAHRVVATLLPRYDHEAGGVAGVAGARPRSVDGHLVLVDLLSDASIELRAQGSERGLVPVEDGRPGMRPLWRTADPTEEEIEERSWWGSEHNRGPNSVEPDVLKTRDLLLSRLLRRPTIANRVADRHGVVNSYSHGGNLVLEWCCGDSAEEIRTALDESGLGFRLPHAAPWADLGGAAARHGDISINRALEGGRRGAPLLTLRSGQVCPDPSMLSKLRAMLAAWYRLAGAR